MKAEIISVGNEVLAGRIVNTNTAYLAKGLEMMGFEVHRQSVVADDENEIIDAVVTASKRSHITVMTGGLGPTKDDLTKESVAKAFGLQLVSDAKAEGLIQKFYDQRGIKPTENTRKQAMVIKGGEILYNDNGTAPGIYIQTTTQAIVMLPGPPKELEPMFEKQVQPRLEALGDQRSSSASLHVIGIGESALEEEIHDLLYTKNPTAALYAKTGEVHIDLIARARTRQEADRILDEKIALIRDRVGDCIYSENDMSIAETVVDLLKRTKCRIAVAESCTGGLMASYITGVEGASKVFDFGVAAYSDAVKQSSLDVSGAIIKKFTSISSATAAEMAKGARLKGRSDIGVGITGETGATSDHLGKPVGLVYVAVADERTVTVKKFNFGNMRDRETLREWTVKNAFDMVRRYLLGIDIEGSRTFGDTDLAEVERGGKPRKKATLTVQKSMMQVLSILMIVVSLFFGYRGLRGSLQEGVYKRIRQEFNSESDKKRVIEKLKGENPDTVGWLQVQGSEEINSVVVASDGEYYKSHDFDKSSSSLGCLYVSEEANMASDANNLVIYGNSSDAQKMFGPLMKFSDTNYLARNYLISLMTLNHTSTYRIFSVAWVNTNQQAGEVQDFYLINEFETMEEFENFVIQAKLRSVITVETDILNNDQFITLTTDLKDWDGARLVVIGRMVREGEDTLMTTAMMAKNASVAYPSRWYEINNKQNIVDEMLELDKWRNWLASCSSPKTLGGSQNGGHDNSGNNGKAISGGVRIGSNGKVLIKVYLDEQIMEDTPAAIVSQIVSRELPASASDETIKALAVAAVSKLRYDLEFSGDFPMVQGAKPTDRITKIVESVIDQCIYYQGSVAYTTYFKTASNRTYSAAELWADGDLYPYLASVETIDTADKDYNHEVALNIESVRKQIEAYYHIRLSDDQNKWVVISNTGSGGVVLKLTIDGQKDSSGLEFMNVLSSDVLSPNFTLSWADYGNGMDLHIISRGSGHGVGLSETGAEYRAAEQRWTYEQILLHYYTGVTIEKMNWEF